MQLFKWTIHMQKVARPRNFLYCLLGVCPFSSCKLKLARIAMCPSWARECLAKTKSSWFGTPASASNDPSAGMKSSLCSWALQSSKSQETFGETSYNWLSSLPSLSLSSWLGPLLYRSFLGPRTLRPRVQTKATPANTSSTHISCCSCALANSPMIHNNHGASAPSTCDCILTG